MTPPPHSYIPDRPIEAAPYHGYCPPEVRQEAFGAVLEGVERRLDRRIIAWLANGMTRRAARSHHCCGAAASRGGKRAPMSAVSAGLPSSARRRKIAGGADATC